MSAIPPQIQTPFGGVPITDSGWEHPTMARPSAGFGQAQDYINGVYLLNYMLTGEYADPSAEDKRTLMGRAVGAGILKKTFTYENTLSYVSQIYGQGNRIGSSNYYHLMDYTFEYGPTSQLRGYGIAVTCDAANPDASSYMAIGAIQRIGDTITPGQGWSSGNFLDYCGNAGDPYDWYYGVIKFRWHGGFGDEYAWLFCRFKHRRTYPYDYQIDGRGIHYFNNAWIEGNMGEEGKLPSQSSDPNSEISETDPSGNNQDTHPEILLDSDDIDLPDITLYPSSAAAGLVTLYAPSLTLMQSFADELWQDNVWETIFQYFGKPSDAIVGMGVLPFSPPTSGYKKPKIGTYTCTTALPVVSNQYHEIDCGSLRIDPVWDSYLDYSPYTRISIYLPYVGTRELDVDEIMGHSLFVKYRVDCYNGNLVAFVGIDGLTGPAVRYQFSGNCMQQLPVNAQSFDAMLAAGVQITTALVGGIASGGAANMAQGMGLANMAAGGASDLQLAQGAANAALGQARRDSALMQNSVGSVMGAKPRVEKNGAIGASIGQMSVQKPFITRIMPNQSLPENYMRYKGYPLNATSAIGDNPGFTVIDDVRLNNLPATIGELDEIYKLLGEGVIV